jgi:hypothetical protein
VASLSKAWVCGRSPAEIAGSIPVAGIVVCLLSVWCVFSSLAEVVGSNPAGGVGVFLLRVLSFVR